MSRRGGQFLTVVIDPPWEYSEGFDGKPLPYKSMSIDEICSIPVNSVTSYGAYVFLWTTSRYIEACPDIFAAWKVRYRQTIVWCKPATTKLGGVFPTNVEFLYVGQRIGPRSNPRKPYTRNGKASSSWYAWPRGSHSEKPAEAYILMEKHFLGPRIEVFARTLRDKWVCIGYDVDGMDIHESLRRVTEEKHVTTNKYTTEIPKVRQVELWSRDE